MIGGETQVLVERAAGGDALAQGDLLERLRPRLVLWCASRMGPGLRAKVQPEDIAQEVLLALHTALPTFDPSGGEGAFLRWVFKIAEFRICDLVDHHGALKRKTVPPRSFAQTSASQLVARNEAVTHLLKAMDAMPEDYRTVIQLRRLEERSFEEVAEIMERSTGATHTLYWRALEALRGEVRKQGALPMDMSL